MKMKIPSHSIPVALMAVFIAVVLSSCGASGGAEKQADESISVATVLRSAPNDLFETINGPPELAFPADHGPHRRQQIEWWYFTGNLTADNGDLFGFQLTFFRIGLTPELGERTSTWAASESYMAHFALTDASREEFHSFERLARGAMGLAGAEASPFKVWTESWSVKGSADGLSPMKLVAAEGGVGLNLSLMPAKALVLQGDQGYSRKGKSPGNASGYVSHTRLDAKGGVVVDGRRLNVSGSAWMDHEWSTSVLDKDLAGWDWFSLQLDDGRELMLYQLRQEGGSPSEFSAGAVIAVDGSKRALSLDEFSIKVVGHWTSKTTGIRYPARWLLEVPSDQIRLEVEPVLAAQELQLSVNYWEGAVRANGTASARGYVELVGYKK